MAASFGQFPANFRFSGALLVTIDLGLDPNIPPPQGPVF